MKLILRVIFWPFSALYDLLMRLRNYLYDTGYTKSFSFQTRVISVGNLSVGGNGKTPMVEYLVCLLKHKYRLAVLSRGYGRSTKGFILADSKHTTDDLGDESMQLFRKFAPEIKVAVGESRALAIPSILLESPDTELIILDDAYQHRTVIPDLNILVTNFWSPFFKDHVLPAGRLRESRQGAQRADLIIVTKCPADLSVEKQQEYLSEITSYQEGPVFFTTITYQAPVPFYSGNRVVKYAKVLLITSIATTVSLLHYVDENFTLVDHLRFRDHFKFQEKHVEQILRRFNQLRDQCEIILTTEKDMVKLITFKNQLLHTPIYYLPITVQFVENGSRFDEIVLNKMQSIK